MVAAIDDIDDIEYLNSIDRGNILWERTFSGLQKALKDKVESYMQKVKMIKNHVVKYNLFSFPHAFQVTIIYCIDVL